MAHSSKRINGDSSRSWQKHWSISWVKYKKVIWEAKIWQKQSSRYSKVQVKCNLSMEVSRLCRWSMGCKAAINWIAQ